MTLKEKDDALQAYCEKTAEETDVLCANCKIEHLCSPIQGEFECHPDAIEQAYELIKNDPVTNPSHYTQGSIECIDAMLSAFGKEPVALWCKCNAFKYLWREAHKNGMEDIDKAIWYLNKFKELRASE